MKKSLYVRSATLGGITAATENFKKLILTICLQNRHTKIGAILYYAIRVLNILAAASTS